MRPKNVKNKFPKLELDILQKSWDRKKSTKKNLQIMGLSYDVNATINKAVRHPDTHSEQKSSTTKTAKSDIAKLLEAEAKAPRVRKFNFPKTQARYFTYLIKKYGDNYKEMAKDPKNVYQETWKKIRSRIRQFKTLEQYQKFMSGQQ